MDIYRTMRLAGNHTLSPSEAAPGNMISGGIAFHFAFLAGHTDMVFASYITSGPHIRSGKLRALAVTSERRLKVLPDVPTTAQAGVPGIELDYWFGLFAPAGTPDAVMPKLHTEFVKAAQFPEVTQPVAAQGVEVITNSREEFAALIARDAARLGKALRDAGVKAN